MFPLFYDAVFAVAERIGLCHWRAGLVAPASGRVLEVGGGTGLNLPYYSPEVRLVLTDPDAAMLARARRRGAGAHCQVDFAVADAQRLPFATAAFDVVVATLAFCTIPVTDQAFAEIRRVLRPGGMLRMMEHVRAPRPGIARLQDLLTPVWRRLAHGCHLNRQPLAAAAARGFTPVSIQTALDGWLVAAVLRRGDE